MFLHRRQRNKRSTSDYYGHLSTSRIDKYLFVSASLFGPAARLFQHASPRKTFPAYSPPPILAKKIMRLLTKQRWS
ncbi:hypothetical protein TsFJ059_009137 [Trichoderma semiorbis]|uniref:Uncharacterized protein n=1 Tax=Trichoderma semiorbis TaxID=1491008 RepID=A0A9P8HCB8_9HYPO|nr:hypothetical protein TsFJ059_009137 [Trichoderma semiorbis]